MKKQINLDEYEIVGHHGQLKWPTIMFEGHQVEVVMGCYDDDEIFQTNVCPSSDCAGCVSKVPGCKVYPCPDWHSEFYIELDD